MPRDHPEQFLRTVLDASPFGVVALDPAGLVQLWSQGAQRILGWSEDLMVGQQPPWQYFSGASAEVRLPGRDGAPIDLEMNTAPWRDGTVVIFSDVTSQRVAQGELRDLKIRERAEHRFRELLEAAPDAIIEIDREGRIILLNLITEKMFGYSRADLLGKSVDILLPEELRSRHPGHRTNYWANPVTRPMGTGRLLHGRRRNGSTFPVEISLSPVESEEGLRVTAIIRDVTDRKESEDRLNALREQYTRELELRNKEIESADRLKSEFLANMSHELRTPLHTVIGFSELLIEEIRGPLNGDQKRFLNHICDDAKHLLTLINEILDLSKIEAGEIQLQREPLDVGDVLEDALASVRQRCAVKAIRIESEIPLSELVDGDRLRVKQILYNLLSNALKFTPEGGQIRVVATAVNGMAQVSVSDTGIGIAADEQELIFDKFHQAGGATSGTREGTGLGLPITKRLVEEHGGRIWLESEPGRGSCFTFTIPLVQRPVAPPWGGGG